MYKYDVWATYRVKTQGWLTVAKHGDRGQAGVILQVHHIPVQYGIRKFFHVK